MRRSSRVPRTAVIFALLAYIDVPYSVVGSEYGVPIEIQLWDTGRSPLAHMVDVTNEFGLKVLAEHNFFNENNIAFSPYGLTGILVALFEGVDGEASYQIQRGMQLPWNRNVMRVGFRDIHRTLKTYFVPEEGFLAGLALNNENVTFRDSYKKILRFYGFDLNNEQLPTLPPTDAANATMADSELGSNTTEDTSVGTTVGSGTTTAGDATTTEGSVTMAASSATATEETPPPSEATSGMPSTSSIDVRGGSITPGPSSAPNAENVSPPETQAPPEPVATTTTQQSITQTTASASNNDDVTTSSNAPTQMETTIAPVPSDESTINNEVEILSTPEVTASETLTTATETTAVNNIATTLAESSATTASNPEFSNTNTTLSEMLSTTMLDNTMTPADMGPADMSPTNIGPVDMSPTNMTPADMGPADMSPTNIGPVDMSPTNMTPIEMSPADMSPADMTASTEPSTNEATMGSEQTTPTQESTLETLERRKKSIVDFIFTNPPYVQDYVYYRALDLDPDLSKQYEYNDDRMFLANGLRNVQVSYMHYETVMEHAYLPHLEAAALRLPLDSERYYLLVVLPERSGARELARLLARLARQSDLRDVHGALRPRRVRATVPSFTVKGHVSLTTDLQKMGIRDVFEPRQRDFTPMTDQSGVYVRSVEQAVSVAIRKYRQRVDAQRDRYVASSPPVQFSATYPFVYFVMDASIHVALMAGKMVDPLNTRIL